MNILTVDLEDWFHILDHRATERPSQWENFPDRVERNTDYILSVLDSKKVRATFFCLGWIAKRHPRLVQKIAQQGHEVACHSMNHVLVYRQSPVSFKEDLSACTRLLEDIVGKKVKTYRAPGFSLVENTKWVFEILAESGIENDCSVFPLSRNHGGFPAFGEPEPCLVVSGSGAIREFPMSCGTVLRKKIVYSGGGYFRLLPYFMIRSLMRNATYAMTYFHPRDFDPDQPVLKTLPLKRKWMSYTGLKGSKKKFERLLDEFAFVNVAEAAAQLDWRQVPLVRF